MLILVQPKNNSIISKKGWLISLQRYKFAKLLYINTEGVKIKVPLAHEC